MLQSSNLVQGRHTPLMHACLLLQAGWMASVHSGTPVDAHTPDWQLSPDAQSEFLEHVHCTLVCVASHLALGPH